MAKNMYLTRKGFREYLAHQGPAQAGVTRDIHECPVALYLSFLTNREWHASGLACVPQVRSEVESHEFKTPKWARDFIHNLDRHMGPDVVSVTGDEALYVLEEYA